MEAESLRDVWVYLAASPLLSLSLTLAVYLGCDWLQKRSGGWSVVNPVLLSIAVLVGILTLSGTTYDTYFEGAQFVHFLLGPATVALAFPLYRQLPKLKRTWPGVLTALLAGGAAGSLSAVWIADFLGASAVTVMSLAPKSVTAPVGMGIAEKIGGLPSLTGVLVVITGVLGAVIGPRLFALLRLHGDSVQGIAIGVTSHGIGTARALQLSDEMGAFAGLGMALSALLASFALPAVLTLLGYLSN